MVLGGVVYRCRRSGFQLIRDTERTDRASDELRPRPPVAQAPPQASSVVTRSICSSTIVVPSASDHRHHRHHRHHHRRRRRPRHAPSPQISHCPFAGNNPSPPTLICLLSECKLHYTAVITNPTTARLPAAKANISTCLAPSCTPPFLALRS